MASLLAVSGAAGQGPARPPVSGPKPPRVAPAYVLLAPGAAVAGQPLLVRGNGFPARRRVLVSLAGRPIARSLTNSIGSFATGLVVPPQSAPGGVAIAAQGGGRRASGRLNVMSRRTPPFTRQTSSTGAELTVSRTAGSPGTRFRLTARGLPPGEVHVRLGARTIARGRTAPGGRFVRLLRIPALPVGRRELRLYAGRLEMSSYVDVQVRLRLRRGAVTLVAAGDVSCQPGSRRTSVRCRDDATAGVIDRLNPLIVAPLGDFQDHFGRLAAIAGGFDGTWGRFKTRMRPTVGNHEFLTFGASGYFTYFGAIAAPPGGYYSYDIGSWHVVVLNSNCPRFISCSPGSPQEQWLRADLAAHPARCTLAYFHHPRFTSAGRFVVPTLLPLWQALYEHGVDVVLNGHAHTYERFAPQNPYGGHDPGRGIRQFIVGTGGSGLGRTVRTAPWSEVRRRSFGVLGLRLAPGSYRWRFHPIPGHRGRDAGAASCH